MATQAEVQAEMNRFPGLTAAAAEGNLAMAAGQSGMNALTVSNLSTQTGFTPGQISAGTVSSSLARNALNTINNDITALSQPSVPAATPPAATPTPVTPQAPSGGAAGGAATPAPSTPATAPSDGLNTVSLQVFGSSLNVSPEVAASVQIRGVFDKNGQLFTRDANGVEIPLTQGLPPEFQNLQANQLRIAQAREAGLRAISNSYALRIQDTEEEQGKIRNQFRNYLITQGFAGGSDAPSALESVDGVHRREINRLELMRSIALDEARQAYLDKDIAAANRFVDEAKDLRKLAADQDIQRRKDALDIQQMYLDIQKEERLQTAEERQGVNQRRDDARLVVQNILNNYGGAAIENLPQEVQEQFAALETASGYPLGFVTSGLRNLRETSLAQTRELAEQRATDQRVQNDILNSIRLANLGIAQARLEIAQGRAGVTIPSGQLSGIYTEDEIAQRAQAYVNDDGTIDWLGVDSLENVDKNLWNDMRTFLNAAIQQEVAAAEEEPVAGKPLSERRIGQAATAVGGFLAPGAQAALERSPLGQLSNAVRWLFE